KTCRIDSLDRIINAFGGGDYKSVVFKNGRQGQSDAWLIIDKQETLAIRHLAPRTTENISKSVYPSRRKKLQSVRLRTQLSLFSHWLRRLSDRGKLKLDPHSRQYRRPPILQWIGRASRQRDHIATIEKILGREVTSYSMPKLPARIQLHHIEPAQPQGVAVIVELRAGITSLHAGHHLGGIPITKFNRCLMPGHLGDIQADKRRRGIYHRDMGVLIPGGDLNVAGETVTAVYFCADGSGAPQVLTLARGQRWCN